MPREIPRTTTTSLYESELLRRSFSLESVDSVSEAGLISCSVSEKQLEGWGKENSNSLMDYGVPLTLSSRGLENVNQVESEEPTACHFRLCKPPV